MSDVSLLVAEEYLENDFFLSDDMDSASDGKIERKIKFIKTIFCVLCFALLCELVIYKYIMPSFSSPKVTVTGQKDYSAEEIARLLLPMNSTTWFDFDVDQAVALLSSEVRPFFCFIESTTVSIHAAFLPSLLAVYKSENASISDPAISNSFGKLS